MDRQGKSEERLNDYMSKHYNTLHGFAERLNSSINMPITHLACKVGIGKKSIYKYINGETMPNSVILARLCKVLNVSADWILFGG